MRFDILRKTLRAQVGVHGLPIVVLALVGSPVFLVWQLAIFLKASRRKWVNRRSFVGWHFNTRADEHRS